MSEPRRMLRQNPSPHVPFVPETRRTRESSTRLTRGLSTGANIGSSHAGSNGSSINGGDSNGTGLELEHEIKYLIARPINENNRFEYFQQQQDAIELNKAQKNGMVPFNYAGLPGVGVQSVSLLTRLEKALECGIPTEIRWALTQIVAMSKNVPTFFDLKKNSFFVQRLVEHFAKCPHANGTALNYPYLLQDNKDLVENSIDAALALRNLCQDAQNASVVSMNPEVKTTCIKILKSEIITKELPLGESYDSATSLLQFTIDIIECISSYIAPAMKDDELFVTLEKYSTLSTDRSLIISMMRSLSRLMVRSNADPKKQYAASENVSSTLLDTVCSYLVVETDPELISTSLDFLYQYVLPGGTRITNLLKSTSRQLILVDTLPRLLTFGLIPPNSKQESAHKEYLKLIKRVKSPAPEVAQNLNKELYDEINKLNEPLRATLWMRCCFRAIPESSVTQISLWKSYEKQFHKEHQTSGGKKLLPAVDFIKNVSNAFPNSAAMVLSNPETGQRKFIIKGIEPRADPVDIQTGNFELANPSAAMASYNQGISDPSLPAQQVEVDFLSKQVESKLSDINNSACLLLNGLVVQDKGKSLVKCIERELIEKVYEVPQLYDSLSDCLVGISAV